MKYFFLLLGLIAQAGFAQSTQSTLRPAIVCPSVSLSLTPTCAGASGGSLVLTGLTAPNAPGFGNVRYNVQYGLVDGTINVLITSATAVSGSPTFTNGQITLSNLPAGTYEVRVTPDEENVCRSNPSPLVRATIVACPMPVQLTSFSGKALEGTVLLSWTTAWETNSAGFTVQKSPDGLAWEGAGFLAGKGTTSASTTYGFTDAQVSLGQTYYYRLKQVDQNGQSAFSSIIVVRVIDDTKQIYLFPNPSLSGQFTIVTEAANGLEVRLVSVTGREEPVQLSRNGSRWTISPARAVPAGVYTVVVTNPAQLFQKSFTVIIGHEQ